jgi:hypothetical protein
MLTIPGVSSQYNYEMQKVGNYTSSRLVAECFNYIVKLIVALYNSF